MTETIRAAGYCRVSTDKPEQAGSFSSQQSFFTQYIDTQPGWVLYDIYADEGVSGTAVKGRAEFSRMMNDARSGLFDIIVTKEVSRFSRNILDTIYYTRELKSLGIGVIFLTDGINTLDADAELRLSIMASIAQEESRKTSARVKWGQTRQMEKGIVFGTSPLGYRVSDGRLEIDEKEAETVRLIFDRYARLGESAGKIARYLTSAGIETPKGKGQWSGSYIIKILRNEKYVGDLIQKKTYTPDYLTHRKKYNRGEVETVSISDHHQPVIERRLWNSAQERLNARRHAARHPASGKIICGRCGSAFISRSPHGGKNEGRWRCSEAVRHGAVRREADGIIVGCDIAIVLPEGVVRSMIAQTLFALGICPENGIVSDKLYGLMYSRFLKSITVNKDTEAELRLKGSDAVFIFRLEKQ